MNLVNDPWIHAITQDGTPRTISLREAFADGESIADLALNPCQRIAVMRLLICIAQAALDGPANEEEWAASRPRLRDAALTYLDRWQHRFELFGEGAFLQVEGLASEANGLADKLDLTAACGNNSTLQDHSATPDGRVPDPAKLAMDLLTYQVYSPGGLIGQLDWDGTTTSKSSVHAPALEGSVLHTYIRASSLLQTLHTNLLHRGQVGAWGRPSWELDPLRRNTLGDNAKTYLGRLVPVCRAIRCLTDSPEITLADAVACPKMPEGREPAATVIMRKRGTAEEPGYVAVSLSKHPWRELSAILMLAQADQLGGALALAHLHRLPGDVFDIWTGGLAADKSKLLDMAEWTFSLSRDLLDTGCLQAYQSGVEKANAGDQMLWASVKGYSEALKDGAPPTELARMHYWSVLDRNCRILAETAIAPDAHLSESWLPHVRDAMLIAYERACPHATPRQIQAYAAGFRRLLRGADSLATAGSGRGRKADEPINEENLSP